MNTGIYTRSVSPRAKLILQINHIYSITCRYLGIESVPMHYSLLLRIIMYIYNILSV